MEHVRLTIDSHPTRISDNGGPSETVSPVVARVDGRDATAPTNRLNRHPTGSDWATTETTETSVAGEVQSSNIQTQTPSLSAADMESTGPVSGMPGWRVEDVEYRIEEYRDMSKRLPSHTHLESPPHPCEGIELNPNPNPNLDPNPCEGIELNPNLDP